MTPLRCKRCNGNLYCEPHTEESLEPEYNRYGYVSYPGRDAFYGWAVKCLLCSRVAQYVTLAELVLIYGVPMEDAHRARWATLAFLWNRRPCQTTPCQAA